MDLETIRRLNLARHLYELGIGSLRTTNDTHLFSAVNLLQDAVEAFLLAIAEHVHAVVDQRADDILRFLGPHAAQDRDQRTLHRREWDNAHLF